MVTVLGMSFLHVPNERPVLRLGPEAEPSSAFDDELDALAPSGLPCLGAYDTGREHLGSSAHSVDLEHAQDVLPDGLRPHHLYGDWRQAIKHEQAFLQFDTDKPHAGRDCLLNGVDGHRRAAALQTYGIAGLHEDALYSIVSGATTIVYSPGPRLVGRTRRS